MSVGLSERMGYKAAIWRNVCRYGVQSNSSVEIRRADRRTHIHLYLTKIYYIAKGDGEGGEEEMPRLLQHAPSTVAAFPSYLSS